MISIKPLNKKILIESYKGNSVPTKKYNPPKYIILEGVGNMTALDCYNRQSKSHKKLNSFL